MKTKTPKEKCCENCAFIYVNHKKCGSPIGCHVGSQWKSQFTVTDEEFEKAKAQFIKSYNSGTAIIFGQKMGVYEDPERFQSDLDALLAMKAWREMPTEDGISIDLKQYITNMLYYVRDKNYNLNPNEFDAWVEEQINGIDEYFKSQSPEAPAEEK